MKKATWWGSNNERISGFGSLNENLTSTEFKLITVDIGQDIVWEFENTKFGLGGYNPFKIIFHNEDPMIERILAIQMKAKLKAAEFKKKRRKK